MASLDQGGEHPGAVGALGPERLPGAPGDRRRPGLALRPGRRGRAGPCGGGRAPGCGRRAGPALRPGHRPVRGDHHRPPRPLARAGGLLPPARRGLAGQSQPVGRADACARTTWPRWIPTRRWSSTGCAPASTWSAWVWPPALEAIRKPAELAGRPFAAGVAEKLVDDLRQVRVPGQEATVAGPVRRAGAVAGGVLPVVGELAEADEGPSGAADHFDGSGARRGMWTGR